MEQMKFYIRHVSHDAYLRLSQAQPAGQLLPLGSDHVVILLEGALQTQQLRRREGRADAFGLPGERSVEQKVLRTAVLTWTHTASRRHHTHTADIAPTVGADGKFSDAPLTAKTQSRRLAETGSDSQSRKLTLTPLIHQTGVCVCVCG